MNVFAKFEEIPSKTLQDIKETKRYGHTFVRSVGRSFGRSLVRTTYKQYTLPQTQFAGGITIAEFANTVDPDETPSYQDLQCLPSSL